MHKVISAVHRRLVRAYLGSDVLRSALIAGFETAGLVLRGSVLAARRPQQFRGALEAACRSQGFTCRDRHQDFIISRDHQDVAVITGYNREIGSARIQFLV